MGGENSFKLHYEVYGEGEPLIMLHGNNEDLTIFYEAKEILQKYYKVYLIDTRGHGKSKVQVGDFHYLIMANDIYSFIKTFQIKDPILYGYSDGAIMALIVALDKKVSISKLILSGINLSTTDIKFFQRVKLELKSIFVRDKRVKSLTRLMIYEPNIDMKLLKKLFLPVYCTFGSRDIVKKSFIRRLRKNSNFKIDIIKGKNHSNYIVNNKYIAELILHYLQSEVKVS